MNIKINDDDNDIFARKIAIRYAGEWTKWR